MSKEAEKNMKGTSKFQNLPSKDTNWSKIKFILFILSAIN